MRKVMNDKKKHYWCSNCHIPLLRETCLNCAEKGHEINSSIKPVFKFEYSYYKDAAIRDKIIPNEEFFPKILYRDQQSLISDGSGGKIHYRIKVLNNISKDSKDLMQAGEFDITLKDIKQSRRTRLRNFYLDDKNYLKGI